MPKVLKQTVLLALHQYTDGTIEFSNKPQEPLYEDCSDARCFSECFICAFPDKPIEQEYGYNIRMISNL
jgi:hypothetical protein